MGQMPQALIVQINNRGLTEASFESLTLDCRVHLLPSSINTYILLAVWDSASN